MTAGKDRWQPGKTGNITPLNTHMSTELTTKRSNKDIRSWLLSSTAKTDLAAVSAGLMSGERLANVLYLCVQKTPALLNCSPASLMSACKTLVIMGCEPDGMNGYLVPRKLKDGTHVCVPIPSARGLMRMARQEGILNVNVGTVYEGEEFHWGIRDGRFYMSHTPDPFGSSSREPRGYYVTWEDKAGVLHGTCMSDAEVKGIRERSDAWTAYKKFNKTCPWVTDYNQMALKTIIKRASKQWDLPVEKLHAMQDADIAEFEKNEQKVMRNVTRLEEETISDLPAQDEQELPAPAADAAPAEQDLFPGMQPDPAQPLTAEERA